MAKISCVDARGKEHWLEETKFIIRPSVYGICMENGKILLTRDIWSGSWGIPGGGIDAGEEELAALQREFLEETGIHIADKIVALLRDVTYFLADGEEKPWKNMRKVYRVQPISGRLKKDGIKGEIAEVKYFPLDEAIKLLRVKKNNQPIAELLVLL